MTPTKFDEIVANLAEKRVQDRVRIFRDDVSLALKKLYGHHCYTYQSEAKHVFALLADNDCRTLGGDIWDKEKAAVGKELLATMDVMQQALVAKPDPDGPQELEPEAKDANA